MAIVYRGVWSDDRPDLLDEGRAALQRWVDGLAPGLVLPADGTARAEGLEVAVVRVADDDAGVDALRIRVSEERSTGRGEERCSTTVHWIEHGGAGSVWVDVERVADDAFDLPPDHEAPELVPMLLAGRVGVPKLGPKPSLVPGAGVDDLVDWLRSPDRTVPVVVFSVDRSLGPAGYSSRVQETARRLAGCADVRMLTVESEDGLVAALHLETMDVYDGDARVYLPGIDPERPEPWRHQIVPAALLTDRPETAASRLARLVLPRAVSQRPPAIYRTVVKPLLDRSRAGDVANWQCIAEDLDDVVSRLKDELEALRADRDLAVMEAAEAERDAGAALQRLDVVRARLRSLGEDPEGFEHRAEHEAVVASCADAVAIGMTLPHLAIHPDAPRDIDRMDQSPHAELWGQRILNHLRALDAYAEAKGAGFVTWCETSGHHRAISTKFISMTEGQTVSTSPRLRAHRLLPVDPAVDPSGHIEMPAHLKPVQGGGMQIPRIYFHDDTKGVTGKVHVGFIGPHDLMPNTLTN